MCFNCIFMRAYIFLTLIGQTSHRPIRAKTTRTPHSKTLYSDVTKYFGESTIRCIFVRVSRITSNTLNSQFTHTEMCLHDVYKYTCTETASLFFFELGETKGPRTRLLWTDKLRIIDDAHMTDCSFTRIRDETHNCVCVWSPLWQLRINCCDFLFFRSLSGQTVTNSIDKFINASKCWANVLATPKANTANAILRDHSKQ